jgi:Domain of unknown function (DUF1707)
VAGPGDERAAAAGGRGRLRASRADRERVIGVLKDAFVQGRLTRQELDARVGQALASPTCADLAVLTADIPAAPAAARLARPPARARRRPLARAAAGSGSCLVIAAAAIWAASILDPGTPGPTSYHSWAKPFLLLAVCAIFMALGILGYGVASTLEQRRSRRPLPQAAGRRDIMERAAGVEPVPAQERSAGELAEADAKAQAQDKAAELASRAKG